jgi:glycosyltransferase involved in cell wall biosynthesis
MNILLVHQNFPSQFRGLAPALVARGDKVVALAMDESVPQAWEDVRIVKYPANRSSTKNLHPWLLTYEAQLIRGDSCFLAAKQLKSEGFTPDVIVVHPGWGESLFIDQVWPGVPIVLYCEYYYSTDADSGFDPEFPSYAELDARKFRIKNTNNIMSFESATLGVSPTQWQANTYPERLRQKIQVIHDGVDTTTVKPNENAQLLLKGKLKLTRQDEVLTFVNRNLEPYRGYHVFMRALPALLRQRPKMQVLIVGGDKVSYGSPSPDGRSWKEVFFTEVEPKLSEDEKARIHFLGQLPFSKYLGLLQVSTVHVYLSYPFVLSWSLLEAMSVGCAIVASNTDPVKEFIKDSVHGFLVDFFDTQALIEQVNFLMDNRLAGELLGIQARDRIVKQYDFKQKALPRWLELIDSVKHRRPLAVAPTKPLLNHPQEQPKPDSPKPHLPTLPSLPLDRLFNFSSHTYWGVKNKERFKELMEEAKTLVGSGYYLGDNLFTWQRNLSPLEDPAFDAAWKKNIHNASDRAIMWRRYILACAAYHCVQLGGDFVECGVYMGSGIKTVMDYLGGQQFPRTFWGYDTYDYNPVKGHAFAGQKDGLFDQVQKRFEGYPQVQLIKGFIPDSFVQGCPDKVAFLHIDLNNAEGELAALEVLFPKMVPGGILVLDDYEWSGIYRPQKKAEDQWLDARGYRLMPLPTGQAILVSR